MLPTNKQDDDNEPRVLDDEEEEDDDAVEVMSLSPFSNFDLQVPRRRHMKNDEGRTTFYPAIPLFDGSILAERGQDLTYDAAQGNLTHAYGREREMRQVAEILRRRVKRNPILVGEAGVGKTAIVEALAFAIIEHHAPTWLRNKKIVAISLFDIIAQEHDYTYGEYAQRLRSLIESLRTTPEEEKDGKGRIAFFDEIHTLKEYLNGANYLKQYLARGEIQLIGATTLDEYRQYIERDPALERRFAPVLIEEPSLETTVDILKQLRPRLESYYNVKIQDSAIKLGVELAQRYIYDRHQPDKSIELIDRACVRVLSLATDLPFTQNDKQIPSPRLLGEGPTNSPLPLSVEVEHVRTIVTEWTGIPDTSLRGERQKYLDLENDLKKYIVGQPDPIKQITRIIAANKAGAVAKPQRPDGVFLFVGPTGVGKTELAKALAVLLTGKEEHLVVLDMTGYRESYTISSLVGVPRGNYDTPELPLLTKLVRDHPFGVLLLDEIEKAHPEVWSIFMPVFEEGTLVDRQGSTIHFSNNIIIMTANVDVVNKTNERFRREKLKRPTETHDQETKLWKDIYYEEVLRVANNGLGFPHEFLNRLDDIVVFYPLTQTHIKAILKMQLAQIEQRLGITFELTPEALDFLLKLGYKHEYGAREMRRIIDSHIGSQLGIMMLKTEIDAWSKVSIIRLDLDSSGTSLKLEPSLSFS
jgi:ATP-dependent Clp protease ATP-binding subunit ClpC